MKLNVVERIIRLDLYTGLGKTQQAGDEVADAIQANYFPETDDIFDDKIRECIWR